MAGEAEFNQAMVHYNAERYREAFPLMKRAAEQGHAEAQFF